VTILASLVGRIVRSLAMGRAGPPFCPRVWVGHAAPPILVARQLTQSPVRGRRRTLLLAVITGNGMSGSVATFAGHAGPHAASQIVTKIPMSAIRAINNVLGRNFVTKYGTKQGVLVLGRELPLGL
jgi:hypothetical protein